MIDPIEFLIFNEAVSLLNFSNLLHYKLLQYKIVIMSLWLLFVTITISKQCDGGLALVFLAQGIFLHDLLKNAVGQTSIFGKTGN